MQDTRISGIKVEHKLKLVADDKDLARLYTIWYGLIKRWFKCWPSVWQRKKSHFHIKQKVLTLMLRRLEN